MDAGHGRSDAAWEAAQRAALTRTLTTSRLVLAPRPLMCFGRMSRLLPMRRIVADASPAGRGSLTAE